MRAKPLLLLVGSVCLLGVGCSRGPDADTAFAGLANRYIEFMLRTDPEGATALGDHRFDDRLTDRSDDAARAHRDAAAAYLDSLSVLPADKLSAENRIDLAILRNHLEGVVFEYDEIAAHTWNPLVHNLGGAIYGLVARDFAPLADRLRSVQARLAAIPAAVANARATLTGRPPLVFTETAIIQNRGTINLILDDLAPFLAQEPGLRDALSSTRAAAIAALESYGSWLQDDLLLRSDGEFRLGEDRFRRKLRLTLESDLTLEDILASARADLEATQRALHETALPLHAELGLGDGASLPREQVVRAVLDRLAEERPDAGNVVERARADLARCTDFVGALDLVTLPDDAVEIIVMPEYQRGFAIAYCDAPGPLAEGEKTFYSISPPPAGWNAEQQASYFREYNDYMLENLTIHEAMPGHYLQLAHANRFVGATPVRALFGSGVFVEGWATYAEQLMAEFGYGGPRVRMQQLKMRLRLIINAIIDQEIHCRGMTEAAALDLMMNDGYQEQGEAAGKWRRAQMSSTQLSTYYVGNLEINRIRGLAEAARGTAFDLKTFHDELLAYGSPAPRHVRGLMGL